METEGRGISKHGVNRTLLLGGPFLRSLRARGQVVELVYTLALEANARNGLRVRVSPCPPRKTLSENAGRFALRHVAPPLGLTKRVFS